MIKLSTVAGLGAIGGYGFTAPACSAKSLSGWVASIDAAFDEMKPLLPQLGLSTAIVAKVSDLVDKGAAIVRKFDQYYRDGKFADAVTTFYNLGLIVADIATELNVLNNRIVTLALLTIRAARVAIAAILDSQSGDPAVKETVAVNATNPAVLEIRKLATMDISGLAKALQP